MHPRRNNDISEGYHQNGKPHRRRARRFVIGDGRASRNAW